MIQARAQNNHGQMNESKLITENLLPKKQWHNIKHKILQVESNTIQIKLLEEIQTL